MIVLDTISVRFFVIPYESALGAPAYAVLPDGDVYIVDNPSRKSLRYDDVEDLLRDNYREVPDLETAIKHCDPTLGHWWREWRLCLDLTTMQSLQANWSRRR